MTEQRACATETGLPVEGSANRSNVKMTRSQMQTEALVIECLLNVAQAMWGSDDQRDADTMVEMAHARARRLHNALDSINAPEEMA